MSGTDERWEYETLRPPRGPTKKEAIDPKAQLNELGGEGWELVTSVEYVGGGTKYLLFKRPVNVGDDTDANDSARSDTAAGENTEERDQ